MKYIKQLTWLFSLAVGLTACSDDNAEEISGGLVIDRDVLLVSAEGGSEEVAVSATQHWVANTADTWLMVTPANGIGSATATVKVDTTLLSGRRDAEVTFVGDNGQRRTLTVSQFGFGKQIAVNKPEVEIENSASYDDREFDITVSANIECKIGSIDYSFEGDISENEMLANESERQGWLLNSKNEDKLAGTSFGIVLDRKAQREVQVPLDDERRARHTCGKGASRSRQCRRPTRGCRRQPHGRCGAHRAPEGRTSH